MKKKGFFIDSQGNKSSKRLAGISLVFSGILGKFFIFSFVLLTEIMRGSTLSSFSMLDESMNWLISAGSALLAGTFLENCFRNKK
jgi:hypothetical protein